MSWYAIANINTTHLHQKCGRTYITASVVATIHRERSLPPEKCGAGGQRTYRIDIHGRTAAKLQEGHSEEIEIHRAADYRHTGLAAGIHINPGSVHEPWNLSCNVLPVDQAISRGIDPWECKGARTGSGKCPAATDLQETGNRESCHPEHTEFKILTPSARREVVDKLLEVQITVSRACEIVGLSRAAYYKRPGKSPCVDGEIASILRSIVMQQRDWGFGRCFDEIRRQGFAWNRKRVYRVYCETGLNRRFTRDRDSSSRIAEARSGAASDTPSPASGKYRAGYACACEEYMFAMVRSVVQEGE
jgi:hypothetical protein